MKTELNMHKYIYPISIALILILYNQYCYQKEIERINSNVFHEIKTNFAKVNAVEIAKINDNSTNFVALENKLEKLQHLVIGKKIKKLDDKIKNINSIQSAHTTQLKELESPLPSNFALFNILNKNNYQTINTLQGRFFVYIQDAKKYMNGYKVTFVFGNPSYASFKPDITLYWGSDTPKTNTSNTKIDMTKINGRKSKQFSPEKNLIGGYWNRIELTLTPATEEELNNISLFLYTNTIFLHHEK